MYCVYIIINFITVAVHYFNSPVVCDGLSYNMHNNLNNVVNDTEMTNRRVDKLVKFHRCIL